MASDVAHLATVEPRHALRIDLEAYPFGCRARCSAFFGNRVLAQGAHQTGLPLIHLDKEFWQPGWVQTPRPEWRAKVAELAAGERWIMDGNYDSSLDLRLPRADTVLWFDYPMAALPAPGDLARRDQLRAGAH